MEGIVQRGSNAASTKCGPVQAGFSVVGELVEIPTFPLHKLVDKSRGPTPGVPHLAMLKN